jgi:hypothetical protein
MKTPAVERTGLVRPRMSFFPLGKQSPSISSEPLPLTAVGSHEDFPHRFRTH